MNYTEQQIFLKYSRLWGAACALSLFALGAACLKMQTKLILPHALIFAFTLAALAGSLLYTPDYLHLNVNLEKRSRWEIKIRWRLIAAVLLIGMFSVSTGRGAIFVLTAIGWLAGANLSAKYIVPSRFFSAYFWAADLILLFSSALLIRSNLLVIAALLAAAAHLSIVIREKNPWPWAAIVFVSGGPLILVAGDRGAGAELSLACAALLLASTVATAALTGRAQRQNAKNVDAALRELMDFKGYSEEKIRNLWSTSNQQLAKNWQSAAIAEDDREQMAQWYRDNSELYTFAISGYNLEYKRIVSNLRMLKYARGSCLDYGAGNGEIILELARRGHAAVYFDVEGETMKFARRRAQRQGLSVEFLHSKDDLAATAQRRRLDTVFSFDVLEHLPDLPGELAFLSSLLAPGGRMVFDVPAGSTKSHPMHLNHALDIHKHMQSKGLKEERSFLQKLPFTKQEKYVFRARR